MRVSEDEAVDKLVSANQRFITVPALHTMGELPLATAYRIQQRVFAELSGGQSSVAGYKISLVAPEHRANFGATEPTYGRLAPRQLIAGSPTLRIDDMHCPLVEPELVFMVEEDLAAGSDVDEVRRKCRIAAGFEIPDSRFEGWFPVPEQTVGDLVADNSFAGLVVHAAASVPACDVDLSQVTVSMTINGDIFGTGVGSAVMGDPVNSVAWLSEALARDGELIRAGQRISAGTFLWPPQAQPGEFEAIYSGVGSVRVTFA